MFYWTHQKSASLFFNRQNVYDLSMSFLQQQQRRAQIRHQYFRCAHKTSQKQTTRKKGNETKASLKWKYQDNKNGFITLNKKRNRFFVIFNKIRIYQQTIEKQPNTNCAYSIIFVSFFFDCFVSFVSFETNKQIFSFTVHPIFISVILFIVVLVSIFSVRFFHIMEYVR